VMFGGAPRRQALDEAGWKRLRGVCQSDSGEHPTETDAAERILADPALYAALAHDERSTLAARPVAVKDPR